LEHKEHKIDKLFKEKLSNTEIPLKEDYWPLIEKNIASHSFYRFGWKHINIYNSSFLLLLVLLGSIILFNRPEKPEIKKTESQIIKKDTLNNSNNIPFPVESTTKTKKNNPSTNNKENASTLIETPQESVKDSVGLRIEDATTKPVNTEPEKINSQDHQAKKRIIYVVQQDTIIEKDTIKVRRKRKK
jgi:hypothetical protein